MPIGTGGAQPQGGAPKPTPGTVIPAGTGWVKQTAPGTFTSSADVPAPEVSYSPATPSDWSSSPAAVASALDLQAQRTGRPIEFARRFFCEEFETVGTTGTLCVGSSGAYQSSTAGTNAALRGAAASELSPSANGELAAVTGTTTAGRAGIFRGSTTSAGGLRISDGVTVARFDHDWTIRVPIGFNAVDTGWVAAGLFSSVITATSPGVCAIMWRYDGGATQQLSAIIRANNIETGSALNVVTLVPGTVYRLRVTSDGINVTWRLATGRNSTSYTTYLTVPASTIIAEPTWQTVLVGSGFRIQKTAGATSVVALADRHLSVVD